MSFILRLSAGAALVLVFLGAVAYKAAALRREAPSQDVDRKNFQTMLEVRDTVLTRYVDTIDAPKREKMIEGAISGMVGSLDDYSMFMVQEQSDNFKKQMGRAFGGVGMELMTEQGTGLPRVITAIKDTPAWKAGILPDDVIEAVDGKELRTLKIPHGRRLLEEAIDLMKGEPDTQVKVSVRRAGHEGRMEIALARAVIRTHSIRDSRMLDERTGLIRIESVQEESAPDLGREIAELRGKGMQALIIDLRDNPGGLLNQAVEIVRFFVDRGTIVSTRGRAAGGAIALTGDLAEVHEAKGPAPYADLKVAVLVNGSSASASEIIAAALQDHGRALIVGTRTFGKGSVQSVSDVPLDSVDEKGRSVQRIGALKLTTARYYRPSGGTVDREGVQPDFAVDVDRKTWDTLREQHQRNWIERNRRTDLPAPPPDPKAKPPVADAQMDRAVELLRMELEGKPLPAADARVSRSEEGKKKQPRSSETP